MHLEWPLPLAFHWWCPPQVRQRVQPSPQEVQPSMVPVLRPLAKAQRSLLAEGPVMVLGRFSMLSVQALEPVLVPQA